MSIDQEYLIWGNMLLTVIGCELLKFRSGPELSTCFIVSLALSALSFLPLEAANQKILFLLLSFLILLIASILFRLYVCRAPKLFQKLFVLDIGIFQAGLAILVYKFV